MQVRFLWIVLAIFGLSCSVNAQTSFVRLNTNLGNMTIMLYDQTPLHKKMFLEQIKKGTYKNAHFNRVIKDFVSQAGEQDEPILAREALHPEKTPVRLPAEIDSTLIHKRGALGAGRDDNPEKSSYLNQIYLVAGRTLTDQQLDSVERKTGRKIAPAHREIYKRQGGVPRLDFDYTIFGEIVEGLPIAEQINSVATGKKAMPLVPVIFNISILGKKEVLKFKNSTPQLSIPNQ